MSTLIRTLAALLGAVIFSGITICGFAADSFLGAWRIVSVRPAPWVESGLTEDDKRLLGVGVEFLPDAVRSEIVLACSEADYERVDLPSDYLFQGNLPPPAAEAAQALGLRESSTPSIRVNCTSGSFDYHFAASDMLLTALDNRILMLARTDSPAATVSAFYGFHLAHDMGFSEENLHQRVRWFAPDLFDALLAEARKPTSPDETPYIDGDPFTDTQEYPESFWIDAVSQSADTAIVSVTFTLPGAVIRSLQVRLQRGADNWLIGDIVYPDGSTLRDLLAASP